MLVDVFDPSKSFQDEIKGMDLNLVQIPEEGMDFGEDDQESDKTKATNQPVPVKKEEAKKEEDKITKEDKIRIAQTLNSEVLLPKSTVLIDAKDLIERGA